MTGNILLRCERLVIITYDNSKDRALGCFTATQEWWGYYQERPFPHKGESHDERHYLFKEFKNAKDAHNFCEAWNAF